MKTIIRTLIIDDSAFVRMSVKEMLSTSPYIEVVGVARDGVDALRMIEELKPDLVTCDLTMPRMDGIAFVREQMSRRALPILILTASAEDSEKAIEAMNAGAVDIMQKPTALANDQLLGIREELVEKVKSLGHAAADKLQPVLAPPRSVQPVVWRPVQTKIVVIGISTGGPQALRYLLPQFPANLPVPIAIVLHMPVGYTAMFAEKLDDISQLKVTEAKEGEQLAPGMALIAQAGSHLALRRQSKTKVVSKLETAPFELLHRPSADVLFQSAAECYGRDVLGVVMTGMGDDGKTGAAWIKSQGGTIFTEAEESCVIYGMPRAVVEAGLSDAAIPLNKMAETIIQKL